MIKRTRNEPMWLHTTFRIGGPAEYYAEPECTEEIGQLIEEARGQGIPYVVIGRGSNLLVGDGGYRGMVICLGRAFSRVTVMGNTLEAQAGAMLGAAAGCALERGLKGMEFASGIPGSVGGALVMNAGAYGSEIKDILSEAELLFPDGEIAWVPLEALDYAYRHSNIEALGRIVLRARFSLQPGERADILGLMKSYGEKRREKQPLEYPSAGSTFKRPAGHFAGQLIEEAGCKGLRVGDAQISEKHAGFLINTGQATARDVRMLVEEVQRRVFLHAGVELKPEIQFIGEFL